MFCFSYTFGTPLFDEGLALRNLVLRVPLNMVFEPEDIAEEWNQWHIGLFDNDFTMLATLTLKEQDNGFKMRQVAVLPIWQGKGIGKKLVHYTEQEVAKTAKPCITLHARESAIPFYKNLGYTQLGDVFEEVGIPHYLMEKKLGI